MRQVLKSRYNKANAAVVVLIWGAGLNVEGVRVKGQMQVEIAFPLPCTLFTPREATEGQNREGTAT